MKKIYKIILASCVALISSCDNDPNPLDLSPEFNNDFLTSSEWRLSSFSLQRGAVEIVGKDLVNDTIPEFEGVVNYSIDNDLIIALNEDMSATSAYTLNFNEGNLVEDKILRLDLEPKSTERRTGGVTSLLPDSGLFLTFDSNRVRSDRDLVDEFNNNDEDQSNNNDISFFEDYESLFFNSSGSITWSISDDGNLVLLSGGNELVLRNTFTDELEARFVYDINENTPIFGELLLSEMFFNGSVGNNDDGDLEIMRLFSFTPTQNNFVGEISITLRRN